VKVAIIYESLTGTTARAARTMAAELEGRGVPATVMPVTDVDYEALREADLVIVGTWTDGIIIAAQKPGRAGRLRAMPALSGKRAVAYCTYAIDPGKALQKLIRIVEDRGAEVVGGMTIRRDWVDEASRDLVDRLLAAVPA
jgi:flavorubredoxin